MDLEETPFSDFVRHPWEQARFRFFCDQLLVLPELRRPVRVIDAGAGDGWFASQLLGYLSPRSTIVCWDAGYGDAPRSPSVGGTPLPKAQRGITHTRAAPEGPFDVTLVLDVLEHVDDDRGFLMEMLARLAHGGILLLSVPAWPILMSSHDERLGHRRRYTPKSGRALLESVGLRPERSGGVFHSLLLPRALQCAGERVLGARSGRHELRWRWGELLGRAVEGALRMDNRVSELAARRAVELPGLSWWALCRAP